MLRMMRDHATSWVVKVILGAIIIVFAFWGVGSFREKRASSAAIVDEEYIGLREYYHEYESMMERTRRQYGASLNNEVLKLLGIKEKALDNVITKTALRQEAERLGFRVTDKELATAIKEIKVFHENGAFSPDRYNNLLNTNQLTPESFEEGHRADLLTTKLTSLVSDAVKVSDLEAEAYYKWQNATVKIDYALFDPKKYEDIETAGEDVTAWHAERKESYMTDPQIRVKFLRFEPEQYKSDITIPENEITAYFESNKEEFKTPKTVEARHILLKTEQNATPEQIEEKKKKALEIMEMAKSGQDFAELAKTHSEGPTKDMGGLLSAFKKEDMVPEFSDKAFSMQPGEIGEPVKTRFGWHVIKVEKVNEASEATLDEAREKIVSKLTDKQAKTKAYEAATEIYDSLEGVEGEDLEKFADDLHPIEQTELFTQKKGPGIPVDNPTKFATVSFGLALNEISEAQELGAGYYVIQPVEKINAVTAEFDAVREKVIQDYTKEKRDEKAKSGAEELLAALKGGESFEQAVSKFDVELKTTDFFKRNQSIPDIGYEQEVGKAAFELTAEKSLPDAPLKAKKGYYVIAFKERKIPETEEFEKEKDKTKQTLTWKKRQALLDQWMTSVKDARDIEILVD